MKQERVVSRFWGDLRSLAVPVATYWVTAIVAFLLFSATIIVTEGPAPENFGILAIFGGTTVFGLLFGQICGLLGLRTWAVFVSGGLMSALLLAAVLATSSLPSVAVFVAIVWFLFPFFATCGWWSLTPNGAMLATFTPLVFIVGTVIAVANKTGSDARWLAGQKWAI